MTRVLRCTLVVVATALAVAAPTAPAAQAAGTVEAVGAAEYRYWSYWQGTDGGWSYAPVGGPARPADGSVWGWRFTVGLEGSAPSPRVDADFASICADTAPVDGHKRVGLVVDYGVSADAPEGESPPAGPRSECVQLPVSANGYDVLGAVTDVRPNSAGLVCGISGYPAQECGAFLGEAAAEPETAPAAEPETGPAAEPESQPPPASGERSDTRSATGGAEDAGAQDVPTSVPAAGNGGFPAAPVLGLGLVALIGGAAGVRAWRARR